MRLIFRCRLRTILVAALALCGASQLALAGAFSYSENFAFFGAQANNLACPASGPGSSGACGAVAAINSFIFLENQYPAIYAPGGKYLLTPNYVQMDNNDPIDAANFAFNGFGGFQGFYKRPNDGLGWQANFINTLSDWFGFFAPGTTQLMSWFLGSTDNNRLPTINDLAGQIKDQEDVEFFVQNATFYHVLTLTAVACDAGGNCTINYQDPNNPFVENKDVPVTTVGGKLTINGVLGSGGPVGIVAEYSESPSTPEPSTLLLLGTGFVGLVVRRYRG